MRTWRGVRITCVGALLLLAAACARDGAGSTGDGPGGGSGGDAGPADPNAVVLRVEDVGGFVSPAARLTRVPRVTIYADGRLITEGPQLAIYPGPALPNLQQQRLTSEQVDRLVEQARAAGVGTATDLGRPPVADVPSTRFTVSSASGGTDVLEVYALAESGENVSGLTEEQRATRAELQKLVSTLTELPLSQEKAGEVKPYQAETIAAVAIPWRPGDNGPDAPPEVAWPGPALPGSPPSSGFDQGCVEVRGAEATALLGAAAKANSRTPWTSGGERWQVALRPLLPDEKSCADLATD
ncbi:hypothetical protein O7626_13150 [Micromonospora sp. WMMD1102]|uniref:hypothetical protein n=1 Tax=Micromonospora sp. WMMD1102 TaxID=3016105 RepID=UPI00241503DC|nr:hypothetical protein [Micromonospora sp. WMMD1102]MDG4786865.1 hypothetical protein [Micromonospora sp. WMMD1102]